MAFKVFSTFTGIGGFEIGIENASVGKLNVEFIGYSEIDKYASSVYESHFKGVKNYGDITKIKEQELPDFDCLVGGFPCQAFSLAGRRAGFSDTRGTLFFDLARILRAKQPRLFVFENVKGLVNHDAGKTFRVIIATLDELGYDLQWQVLNSKNHRVPQNRERVIIVGHLRGSTRPQVFPYTRTDSQANGENTEIRSVAQTITATYHKGGKGSHVLVDGSYPSRDPRVYDEIAPTVRDYGSGGNKMPVVLTASPHYKDGKRKLTFRLNKTVPTITASQGKSADNQPRIIQDVRAMKKSQNGKGFKDGEDAQVSYTIDTLATQGIADGLTVRRLTPMECERLQAFPDNWTQYGKDGDLMSNTQRYKMCGNAVTTNVIKDVFERIFDTVK